MRKYLLLLLIFCTTALAKPLPKIAIIIDDLGNSSSEGQAVAMLPGQVTCSIMPHRPFAVEIANSCHEEHKNIIVHVPMEAEDHFPMGAGGLSVNMTSAQIQKVLLDDLKSVPFRVGFNNHMGSLFTQDKPGMSAVMQAVKPLHLFYIDSLTDSRSVAYATAKHYGVPTLQRNVFLDDKQNLAYIDHQFHILIRLAKEHGYAIGIGHPHPATLEYLQTALNDMRDYKVQLVPLSQLVAEHGIPVKSSS